MITVGVTIDAGLAPRVASVEAESPAAKAGSLGTKFYE